MTSVNAESVNSSYKSLSSVTDLFDIVVFASQRDAFVDESPDEDLTEIDESNCEKSIIIKFLTSKAETKNSKQNNDECFEAPKLDHIFKKKSPINLRKTSLLVSGSTKLTDIQQVHLKILLIIINVTLNLVIQLYINIFLYPLF